MQQIAVFDSGIGGISVLAELKKVLPQESFFYFADIKNAPYGNKTSEEIKDLMRLYCQDFIDKNFKALVIACNTATSAAASALRKEFPQFLIFGI